MSRWLLGFIFVLACDGETIIEKRDNAAPTILIVSHSDGAQLEEGEDVSFRASVSDETDDAEDLSVAWYVGQDLMCDWAPVSVGGDQTCTIMIDTEMTSVVAEVRDPEGAGGRSEIAISVVETLAPEAIILSPEQGSRHYSDQLVHLSGVVSDAEDDVEDLYIQWSSSVDGTLVLPQPDSSGAVSDYVFLTEGQHAIELVVEDSSGKRTSSSTVIDVGAANSLPSCQLEEPIDGETIVTGSSIRFRGLVDDPDIPNDQLQIEWRSDKDGVFGTSSAGSDGTFVFTYDGLSTDEHLITMQVQDEIGATCTEQIVLLIGNPPTVTIDPSLDGAVYNLGEMVSLLGTVADNEDLSNLLVVEWSSSLDGVLYTNNPTSQGSSQYSLDTLNAGTHLVTLTVTDTSGLWTDDTVTITINTPPPTPGLTLTPSSAYTSDTLMAMVTPVADLDGDTVTYNYEWFENYLLTSFNTDTIDSSELSVGEIWTVRVTPNDGIVDGNSIESSVTILNSTPSISNVAINPTLVFTGNTITCSATAMDADDGTLVPSFDWTVNGTPSGTGSNFTVTQGNSNVGDTIICTAIAQDSGMLMVSDTAFVTVSNAGPSVSNVSITSLGGYYNDQTLTCSAVASDPDESLVPVFEWLDSSGSLGVGDSIDLTTTSLMPSDSVMCSVSATDTSGLTAQAVAQITIANRQPNVPIVTVSPSSPIPSVDDVTCSVTNLSDPDGESVTVVSYDWLSDLGNVAFGPVLSSNDLTDLETWTCTVTVTDGSMNNSSSDSVQAIAVGIDPVEFTNCGQMGHTGPSQSQCDSEYDSITLNSFGYPYAQIVSVSSGVQAWEVPYTGTYTIETMGAQGGAKYTTVGGSGAYVSGEFNFIAGEVLYIVVGQKGTSVSGQTEGGGGGGGSFVFDENNNPLIIAGGGGGTSYQQNGGYGGSPTTSSVGGGYGQSSSGNGGFTDNGGGGGTGCGGGGLYDNGTGNSWCNGGSLAGGTGGTSQYSGFGGFGGGGAGFHGGGGGGGYTGGGGGTYTTGGGGAGSYNAGGNTVSFPNYHTGDGRVYITQ